MSEKARKEGNALFATVTDGLSPILWVSRLKEALTKYNQAVHYATNDDQLASASKNCAVASGKMATYLMKSESKQATLIRYHFKEMVKHYGIAFRAGQKYKSLEWKSDLKLRHMQGIYDIIAFATSKPLGDERINVLQLLLESEASDEVRGECFLEVTSDYFKEAVFALGKDDYKKAISSLAKAHRPLEELKKCGRALDDQHLLSEAEVLENDIFLQTCTAESLQARFIGDDLLQKAMSDYESLPVHLIWDVIDWYTKARLLCKETDLEMEAIACCRLGNTYYNVLKIKYLAKQSLSKANEIVDALAPRTFHETEWFVEMQATLGVLMRDDIVEQEKQSWAKKSKVKEELKPEIKELDAHSDAPALLEFVYKKYPSTNKNHQLAKNFRKKPIKKMLSTAILHYHPDKIDLETHGLRKKVLYEEITKVLTKHFNMIKSE